jgi:biotin carboxylase
LEVIRSGNRPLGDARVLFVGAGRHQRRALVRLRELGVRVVAVDRNPDAPGLAIADVGEVVDLLDVPAVVEAGRRHGVDGVMTYAADRAVPVVAAVAEALDLPGIGTETAHLMTNKIAMRRQLADAGVPLAAARVGSHSPLEAVGDELQARPGYDRIVLSTFPPGVSRWLKGNLPAILERRFRLPVDHVTSQAGTPSPS